MWFSHDGADRPVLKLTGAKLFLNGRGECGGECDGGVFRMNCLVNVYTCPETAPKKSGFLSSLYFLMKKLSQNNTCMFIITDYFPAQFHARDMLSASL